MGSNNKSKFTILETVECSVYYNNTCVGTCTYTVRQCQLDLNNDVLTKYHFRDGEAVSAGS